MPRQTAADSSGKTSQASTATCSRMKAIGLPGASLPSRAMTDDQTLGDATSLPGSDQRSNGLAPEAPERGLRILLAGGAGYIGCVLAERLLKRGYQVRIPARLWGGEEPLAAIRDRIEIVNADVRDVPEDALDDVDAVINLSGLS